MWFAIRSQHLRVLGGSPISVYECFAHFKVNGVGYNIKYSLLRWQALGRETKVIKILTCVNHDCVGRLFAGTHQLQVWHGSGPMDTLERAFVVKETATMRKLQW